MPASVPAEEERSFPHPEPTPYHLMLRTRDYAWWRPMVGVLVAVLWFFIGASLVFLISGAGWALFQGGSFTAHWDANTDMKHIGPPELFGLDVGLASMIPLTWFLMRSLHRLPPRWLASVVPRLRWRFLAVCLGLALVALAAQVLVGLLVPGRDGNDLGGGLNHFTATTAASLLVIVLTTPFQAAGEEYLFRGYLMQAFGSLFGNRWVAIVASATLFALAHGSQNAPLFFDRLAFGLIAGWLVTRTGGLEAGIALHVLNNYLAFGFALAFGSLSSSLTSTSASWWNIPVTITQSVVYTGLVVLAARRMNLRTLTDPPAYEPPPRAGARSLRA